MFKGNYEPKLEYPESLREGGRRIGTKLPST